MKLKHHDIKIEEGKPFENCSFKREKYSRVLTQIVTSYADGFVMAINNEWGTGKTTFVQMWQQSLKDEKFQTLYFNAWENDFESNPQVAIFSELKTLTGNGDNKTFKSLLKKGAVLSKSLIPLGLTALVGRFVETKGITEAIEKISASGIDIFEGEVNEYAARKKGVLEFKKELEIYISKRTSEKPLIFIIDELDRCRPDYAVEVLEQIKHFFSVPGIVFVLSIDKEQLGNSIKGYYGSESLNADEYLRRFIDIEYRLPAPSSKQVCEYFFKYFQFDEFFKSEERLGIPVFEKDRTDFLAFATFLVEREQLTLRQVERFFVHGRLALTQFSTVGYMFPSLFVCLLFLRDYKNEIYTSISQHSMSPQQSCTRFEDAFLTNLPEELERPFADTVAVFILLYTNQYKTRDSSFVLIERNESGNHLKVASKAFNKLDERAVLSIFKEFSFKEINQFKLDRVLNRLELLEDITI